jgi:hypothetical protein
LEIAGKIVSSKNIEHIYETTTWWKFT